MQEIVSGFIQEIVFGLGKLFWGSYRNCFRVHTGNCFRVHTGNCFKVHTGNGSYRKLFEGS